MARFRGGVAVRRLRPSWVCCVPASAVGSRYESLAGTWVGHGVALVNPHVRASEGDQMSDDFRPRNFEPHDYRSTGDDPADDKIQEERSPQERPQGARPPGDQGAEDAALSDRPWEDRPREAQPHEDFKPPGESSSASSGAPPPAPAPGGVQPAGEQVTGGPGSDFGPPLSADAAASPATAPEGPGPVPVESREAAPAPPPGTPRDPNIDAIARAGLAADMDSWLREVAGQVDPRLDRVAPRWRASEQSGAARACVFGLMLGRLANDYPHTSGDLGQVAEAHPSFATLTAGSRLATLREIAQDPGRGAAWVAPLVGLEDPSPLRDILD